MSKPRSPKPEEAVFQVKVVPRSSQSRLSLEPDGTLKAWVNSPPVGGAANEAVCRLIADALSVPKTRVFVVTGHTSRLKKVAIEGLSQLEAALRIG